jgi:hypothetical protein
MTAAPAFQAGFCAPIDCLQAACLRPLVGLYATDGKGVLTAITAWRTRQRGRRIARQDLCVPSQSDRCQ